MGIHDGTRAFIGHECVDGAPSIFIGDESTGITLMHGTAQDHFMTSVNDNLIGQPLYIAQTLFDQCNLCGVNLLTINGKTEDMVYNTDVNNLARYIQSVEYKSDDIYKQMLVGVIQGIIIKCLDSITSYKQLPVQKTLYNLSEKDIQRFLKNLVIHRDEFTIFAGKCVRYLEILYTGQTIVRHGYVPGYYGYYDTFIDKYTRIN